VALVAKLLLEPAKVRLDKTLAFQDHLEQVSKVANPAIRIPGIGQLKPSDRVRNVIPWHFSKDENLREFFTSVGKPDFKAYP
jgi:hypothetical protein